MVDIISRGENFILIFRVLVIIFVKLIVNRIMEINVSDINAI